MSEYSLEQAEAIVALYKQLIPTIKTKLEEDPPLYHGKRPYGLKDVYWSEESYSIVGVWSIYLGCGEDHQIEITYGLSSFFTSENP